MRGESEKPKKDNVNSAARKALNEAIKPNKNNEITRKKIAKGGVKQFQKALVGVSQLELKIENIQAVKKNSAMGIFVNASEEVAKRLVNLALGQNGFHDAPASVQRLAMVDVLTYAGISAEQAEKQAKDVKDMTREELEQFLRATASIVEKVNSEQPVIVEGETIATDSIIDQLR
jgi:hypothetical protein